MTITNPFSLSVFKMLGLKSSLAFLITSLFFAGSIFYVGVILQSLIDAAFGISAERTTLIHSLSNCDCLVPRFMLDAFGSMLMPGLIFVILFSLTNNKSWKISALYGALSLIIFDVGLAFFSVITSLSLSIVCDLIGGPIAGLVIGYLLRSNLSLAMHASWQSLAKSVAYLFAIIGSIFFVLTILYGLFLYPISRDVNLVSNNEPSDVYVLEKPKKDFVVRDDSIFKDLTSNFPVENLFIQTHLDRMVVNTTNVKKHPIITFPNTKSVNLTVMGFYGCESNKDVILLYNKNRKYRHSLDLQAGDSLELVGAKSKITAIGKTKNEKANIYFGGQTLQNDSIKDKLIVSQFSSVDIGVHLKRDTYLFYSSTPQPDTFFDKHGYVPERTDEYEPTKLVHRRAEKVIEELVLYPQEGCNCVCTPQNLRESAPLSKPIIGTTAHGVVLRVGDISYAQAPFIKISVPDESQLVYKPIHKNILGLAHERLDIAGYAGKIPSGTLSYGLSSHDLDHAFVRMTGKELFVKKSEDGKTVISGRASFLEVNGTILSTTLLSSVDVSILVVFLTTLIGVIGLALKKYGRKSFNELLHSDNFPY